MQQYFGEGFSGIKAWHQQIHHAGRTFHAGGLVGVGRRSELLLQAP
ncbi:hypothetical protein [Streptomyces lunaelactis]|nr:hypothetical protein [Streptomyces lunaelactis]NUK87125.1 hypothetical protein [Streptomyces lunaelactis]